MVILEGSQASFKPSSDGLSHMQGKSCVVAIDTAIKEPVSDKTTISVYFQDDAVPINVYLRNLTFIDRSILHIEEATCP